MDTFSPRFTTRTKEALTLAALFAQKEKRSEILPVDLTEGILHVCSSLSHDFFPQPSHARVPSLPRKSAHSPRMLSADSKKILTTSAIIASLNGHSLIGIEHLVAALIEINDATVVALFDLYGIDAKHVVKGVDLLLANNSKVQELFKAVTPPDTKSKARRKKNTLLPECAVRMTDPEIAKKYDTVIGRDREINNVIRVLLRRSKNNPVLVGEPGVGKTALVEGLAARIVAGDVPKELRHAQIYSLQLSHLVAGTSLRGDMEAKLKELFEELQSNLRSILFIDELHTIVGAGSASGSLDIAQMIKPLLARGTLRCIGATTDNEYRRFIMEDGALERRFQPIRIEEPSRATTEHILRTIAPRLEAHHHVTIDAPCISAAVTLAQRFTPHRRLPDAAIDLLDEACAEGSLQSHVRTNTPDALTALEDGYSDLVRKQLTALYTEFDVRKAQAFQEKIEKAQSAIVDLYAPAPEDVHTLIAETHLATVLAERLTIPVDRITATPVIPRTLRDSLESGVVGQPAATTAIATTLTRALAGLRDVRKPFASLLFVGPSGSGKTHCAKAIAAALFTEQAFLRLDMTEFSESISLARLIGAPAGYIGYKDAGVLTDFLRKHPHALILFDEIDKAHPRVVQLILQILEEGILTDASGGTTSFRESVIVFTANSEKGLVGAPVGFESGMGVAPVLSKDTLNARFGSEFMGRLDAVVPFVPLEPAALTLLAEQTLITLRDRLAVQGRTLRWSARIPAECVRLTTGTSLGARALFDTIRIYIEDPLVTCLLASEEKIFEIRYTDTITVHAIPHGTLPKTTKLRHGARKETRREKTRPVSGVQANGKRKSVAQKSPASTANRKRTV